MYRTEEYVKNQNAIVKGVEKDTDTDIDQVELSQWRK